MTPSAKTAANRQAARAEAAAVAATAAAGAVCVDARGARIRTVAIHLTGFAPRCEGLAIDNPRRWATLYGVSPERALRALLKRLARAPRAVRFAPGPALGDVDVLAEPTVQAMGRAGPDALVPFATVWDGLTEAELTEAQAALIAAGWEPPGRVGSGGPEGPTTAA
ncbi:hypothetical protein [Phenylobacterium sp.]|uniref:hypothetical protein n=1 Tax=Phenylobacterium sp. TaxID=1871053 RepID=UPI00301D58C6